MPAHSPTSAGHGGLIHYDYLVDANYGGTPGDSFTLTSGSTMKVYTTVQGAINAADTDNADRSVFVNGGTYNENVSIPVTLVHKLWLVGEGTNKVSIQPSSGNALAIPGSGLDEMWFKNIRFFGAAGSYSVYGNGTNIPAHFEDCYFIRKVAGDFAGAIFNNCVLEEGYHCDFATCTPSNVRFDGCLFPSTKSTWSSGSVDEHVFSGCMWSGVNSTIEVTGADVTRVRFDGGQHVTSVATTFFLVNSASSYVDGVSFSGFTFYFPGANGCIYVQSHQGSTIVDGFAVVGCHFVKQNTSSNPYIKCSDVDSGPWTIVGNRFGQAADGHVEDVGGVSITGIFIDSVFGPNSPPVFKVQLNASSQNL